MPKSGHSAIAVERLGPLCKELASERTDEGAARPADVGHPARLCDPAVMPHQRVKPFLRSAARAMRGSPVDVEEAVWWRLRGRKLGGLKFRRQHPIGRYIADFACLEARLIIEIDGAQHARSDGDRLRLEALLELGFRVIRFANERVRADIDAVCKEILEVARPRARPPHPSAPRPPSPARGEG